jgi:hypothetical protein
MWPNRNIYLTQSSILTFDLPLSLQVSSTSSITNSCPLAFVHSSTLSLIRLDIRERRGSNVSIDMPLYKDTHTDPYIDAKLHSEAIHSYANGKANGDANGTGHAHANGHPAQNGASQGKEFNIHMDAMGFGMGCCCLQVNFLPSRYSLSLSPTLPLLLYTVTSSNQPLQCTFQCCNISEARFFYDQLAVMAPIMVSRKKTKNREREVNDRRSSKRDKVDRKLTLL